MPAPLTLRSIVKINKIHTLFTGLELDNIYASFLPNPKMNDQNIANGTADLRVCCSVDVGMEWRII